MTTTTAPTCCDGTGYIPGDPYARCVDHYEQIDPIWAGNQLGSYDELLDQDMDDDLRDNHPEWD